MPFTGRNKKGTVCPENDTDNTKRERIRSIVYLKRVQGSGVYLEEVVSKKVEALRELQPKLPELLGDVLRVLEEGGNAQNHKHEIF